MNRIEISVINPGAALDAFADIRHQAERSGSQAQPAKLAFGSLHDLFHAITERRLMLLRAVASERDPSIHTLGEALGQDQATIRADVDALLELGLLERTDDGWLEAPFGDLEKLPSWQFFKTRSENAVFDSLNFSSAWALEKWQGLLPRTGTSNASRCPFDEVIIHAGIRDAA